MNMKKILQFVALLERQVSGDVGARDDIYGLGVTLEDGYCLFNLHEQWAGAFSYNPGRTEALPLILSLGQKMIQYGKDDTLRLYNEPEWVGLVGLRGPVETVTIHQCSNCSREYPCMGTSGFYDAAGIVCPKCGDVYFKSYYENDLSPCPNCGEKLPDAKYWGCPRCHSKDSTSVARISPYEYFSTHGFKRGTGA
jgi:hypothetical protein